MWVMSCKFQVFQKFRNFESTFFPFEINPSIEAHSNQHTEAQLLKHSTSFQRYFRILWGTYLNSYCRESGVRNLKKHIEKIHRKTAFKLIQKNNEYSKDNLPSDSIDIQPSNLKDFVGQPIFTKERWNCMRKIN